MCSSARRKKASNKLLVDQIMSDDDSVVLLPPETMQSLYLSHGDPVWIKGKKGRQTISIAIAYDDTCKEPKIRLNRVVMNDLLVRIGGIVSVHRRPDVERPLHILSTDDNLKLAEFLNNVPDNILFEIFLRLPNGRSAVQYSSVCKRWYFIISSFAFVRSFIHIHDHISPQSSDDHYFSRPFTLLFVRYDRYLCNDDDHYFEPFCQVCSEKSRVPHGKMPPIHLNFLPYPVAILASFNDLVLVTSLEHSVLGHVPNFGAKKNYICNPLTKQWLELPEVSVLYFYSGYGLIFEPTNCNKQLGCIPSVRYRVVIIGRAHSSLNGQVAYWMGQCKSNEFIANVFCSETGQWSELVIAYPPRKTIISHPEYYLSSPNDDLHIVPSNGILYWLEGNLTKGIVAFDPFNDICTGQCRLIHLPTVCFETTLWSTDEKLRLGLVNGQLRLSQLYKAEAEAHFVFRVWELKNHDSEFSSWVLVYNLKLNCSQSEVFVLSFHPTNTNIVFLLCGNDVCQYDIFEQKYEKIGEYPEQIDTPDTDISTFTLLYPSWPTPIPVLTSSYN